MVIFTIGELFNSFADVQEKLCAYSEENFCHFYVKDSKKLTLEETLNPDLVYKHIAYSCIYGGQKARFRGSGTRSVTSIRHGCSSLLYLRVTRDRQHLVVRNFIDTHNHEISEEIYRSASQDRKLPWELKLEVEDLLLLGADKDRIIEYIRNTTNKNLDKKHLFNLYETALKHQREISKERALMLIQKVYCVETEDEADLILNTLLESDKLQRKHRKSMQMQQDNDDSVQYTYINESEDAADGEMGEELQRIMGTLHGSDNERIVIVEGDEQYEVIETDPLMEAEYLEDEEREPEVTVKQEQDSSSVISNSSQRFRQFSKRPVPVTRATRVSQMRAYTPQDHYEPPRKKRSISNNSIDDDTATQLQDLKSQTLHIEKEKLAAEVEMLKLKRNKLTRDISKVDLEKSKVYLEIDFFKQQKKYLADKQLMTDLKKEKLRLEIAKLKSEM